MLQILDDEIEFREIPFGDATSAMFCTIIPIRAYDWWFNKKFDAKTFAMRDAVGLFVISSTIRLEHYYHSYCTM